MNDIRKNLQTIDGLEEQLITKGFELGSKLLGKSGSKIKPQSGPVTEIPPFDMNSPAAQAAAAARQAKQQPAIDRLQGIDSPSPTPTPTQKPKIRMQPGETYDDAVKRAQDQEAADSLQRVLKQPKRGPDYRSPYDDATPSGLEPLPPKVDTPSVTSAADSDILKGIESAKEMIRQANYSRPRRAARWADRKLQQHGRDIGAAATGLAVYKNWDEIKDIWDRYNLSDIPGVGTADKFLANQLDKVTDYLKRQNTTPPMNETAPPPALGSDPNDWTYDEKKKIYRFTGSGSPTMGRTVVPDVWNQEVLKPYLQSIQSDPGYKTLSKAAQEVWKSSQGKSILGRILGGLTGKKMGWTIAGGAVADTALQNIAPEFAPSSMGKELLRNWRATAPAPTAAPAPAPTAAPAPAATPAPAPTAAPAPAGTSTSDREPARIRQWRDLRTNENINYTQEKYLHEFKRYIDSV